MSHFSTGSPLCFHTVLNTAELTAFLSWRPVKPRSIEYRDSLIIGLAGACGLRRAEIAAVCTQGLFLEAGRPWIEFMGKGRKWRAVPLPGWLNMRLLAYKTALMLGPGPLVRTAYSPFRPIVPHCVYMAVLRRSRQVLGFTVRPHTLRHSAASLWLRNGATLKTVQLLLGHSNIATTSRYLHSSSEELIRAIEGLQVGPVQLNFFPEDKIHA